MLWERSRLSHQVRRMEARGLVDRVGCKDDRRGAWVGITDAGRAASEEAPATEAAARARARKAEDAERSRARNRG